MASGRGANGVSKVKQKNENSKVYSGKTFKGFKYSNKTADRSLAMQPQMEFGILDVDDGNMLPKSVSGVDSGYSSSEPRPVGNCEFMRGKGERKTGFLAMENLLTINLSTKSTREVRELRTKLKTELDNIRSLLKKLDSEEVAKAGVYSVGKSKRAHSEVESVGSLNHLSVSMVENGQGGSGSIEKEKHASKVDKVKNIKGNHHTRETKKLKSSGKKGGEEGDVRKFPIRFVKSCGCLLDRLMKHKHGWVFNKPVDPVALGLDDYFDIIKNPMDLDTIKSRLSKNWYKSPQEFAEDVRLTFRNAMAYNPKGYGVHVMAEILLKLFEDKWAAIEADYTHELMSHLDHGDSLSIPTSRKAPPPRVTQPELSRDFKTNGIMNSASVKSAAPSNRKAKEAANKREMTYGEKQKLSEDLQSLPSEKLENVVQIIKKRNPSLCQNDDEIEVDIDSMDTETLWELHGFVTDYKKGMSDIIDQSRWEAIPTI